MADAEYYLPRLPTTSMLCRLTPVKSLRTGLKFASKARALTLVSLLWPVCAPKRGTPANENTSIHITHTSPENSWYKFVSLPSHSGTVSRLEPGSDRVNDVL